MKITSWHELFHLSFLNIDEWLGDSPNTEYRKRTNTTMFPRHSNICQLSLKEATNFQEEEIKKKGLVQSLLAKKKYAMGKLYTELTIKGS